MPKGYLIFQGYWWSIYPSRWQHKARDKVEDVNGRASVYCFAPPLPGGVWVAASLKTLASKKSIIVEPVIGLKFGSDLPGEVKSGAELMFLVNVDIAWTNSVIEVKVNKADLTAIGAIDDNDNSGSLIRSMLDQDAKCNILYSAP